MILDQFKLENLDWKFPNHLTKLFAFVSKTTFSWLASLSALANCLQRPHSWSGDGKNKNVWSRRWIEQWQPRTQTVLMEREAETGKEEDISRTWWRICGYFFDQSRTISHNDASDMLCLCVCGITFISILIIHWVKIFAVSTLASSLHPLWVTAFILPGIWRWHSQPLSGCSRHHQLIRWYADLSLGVTVSRGVESLHATTKWQKCKWSVSVFFESSLKCWNANPKRGSARRVLVSGRYLANAVW